MSGIKPEAAATLLLVRDSDLGLEVFMVQRPSRGAFPGLHVFTGGKVDLQDAELVRRIPFNGVTERQAQQGLASPLALHYYLAAIRECFEEAGVLLASTDQGLVGADLAQQLQLLRDGEFSGVCAELGVSLEFGELHYFSHWITPDIAPRRFDTRFFVARMPAGQFAVHAEGETVGGEWVEPKRALARGESGEWALIMPTIVSLQSVANYSSTQELFKAVRGGKHLPPYSEALRVEGMQPFARAVQQ